MRYNLYVIKLETCIRVCYGKIGGKSSDRSICQSERHYRMEGPSSSGDLYKVIGCEAINFYGKATAVVAFPWEVMKG